jgi:transcriptional regulator with XRE-family HTH domain
MVYDSMELEYKLIDAVIEQRIKHGLTQKQLAKKIGTKQSAISRFERGGSNPSLAFLKKLASALGMKLTATAI